MTQWQYTDKIQLTGGERPDLVVSASEKIPIGWFEYIRNMAYDKSGILTKRRGFGEWESSLDLATICYGLYTLYTSTGKRYRLALDTYATPAHLRIHYLESGGTWVSSIVNFLPTPYMRTRGAQLRDNFYITNGKDDLRFFHDGDTYGKCGVWPPTNKPSFAYSDDPVADATNNVDLAIEDSGFLQYIVIFGYQDSINNDLYHWSPASARTDLINYHWGDIDLTYNEEYGYIKRGVTITIPTNSQIDSNIRDRVRHRRIYRRYKKYIDQPWSDWVLAQEIYTGTDNTWVDVESTPLGTLPADNDVPPVGEYVIATSNRLFLGNLEDRVVRQPSLISTWREGTGYTPYWPYKVPIYITDTNDKVVTRGMVEMKFTNDVAHATSTSPLSTGVGAYLSGLSGINLLDIITTATPSTGITLDDMTSGGTYSGTTSKHYKVQIDGEGTPDTYKWSDNGGVTWNASTQAIGVGALALNTGVTITFAATTGHSSGDYWTFSTGYHDVCFTADDGITEIGYVVTALNSTDITLLVEIPQLNGTELVYLFYGDVNAPGYSVTQWESVFHKLYASTDMDVLCNFDDTGNADAVYAASTERIYGRDVLAVAAAVSKTGADSGYSDDNSSWTFSAGDSYTVPDSTGHIPIYRISDATKREEISLSGTMQFRVLVDVTALDAGAAGENEVFFCMGTTISAPRGTFRMRTGVWYFQIATIAGNLLQDNGVLGIALPNFAGTLDIFISFAWGEANVSRTYLDSTAFTGGPVTSTNYDSTALAMEVFHYIYIANTTNACPGVYDEFVIYNREVNSLNELDAMYKRRTYWENTLQMEIGDIDSIYDITNSIAIRDKKSSRLTWSDYNSPDVFQVDNFKESDTSAELTGLVPFRGNIIVLYYNEVRILNTSYPEGQQLFTDIDDMTQMWTLSDDTTSEISNLGCIAPDSVKATDSFIIFYGLAGLYAFDMKNFYYLSKALDKYLNAIPICYRQDIQGQVISSRGQYLFSVPSGVNTANDQVQSTADGTKAFGKDVANEVKIAQSFIPTHNLLSSVTLDKDANTGTFTGTVIISIQSDNSGEPDGVAICTSTISNATWTAISVGAFTVSLSANLIPGDTYYIVLAATASIDANHPNVGFWGASDVYANGSLFDYKSSVWAEVTGDDLYFITKYAYHDRVHVLDINSIGQDPDKVRWTEYRWGDDTFLNIRGFSLFEDIGDDGELIVLDSAQGKLWKYDNGEYYDDSDSHIILSEVKTGAIDLRNVSMRKIETNYTMMDSDNIYHSDDLNLDVYNEVEVLCTISPIEDCIEELLPKGTIVEAVSFRWYEETNNGLALKDYIFEYKNFRKKRKMYTAPTPMFLLLTSASPIVIEGITNIEKEMITSASAIVTVA